MSTGRQLTEVPYVLLATWETEIVLKYMFYVKTNQVDQIIFSSL